MARNPYSYKILSFLEALFSVPQKGASQGLILTKHYGLPGISSLGSESAVNSLCKMLQREVVAG
jgi:hypothetical protein